ncbi:MAG: hypothetical protein M4579_000632 [Chaenotheca gracillima]|nr:MAG: hypothetical protein M4579_000632 [Chaenotheca gracillima]
MSTSPDSQALFASPSKNDNKTNPTSDLRTSASEDQTQESRNAGSRYDTEEARIARDVALKKELDGVRHINEVIEGVVESLERAKGNMDTVSRTVNSASTLLNSWMRILSQTEHNQRLLLDPTWQGASQDVADVENESILKQQAAERRDQEEQQRRQVAARRAEDDERRRTDASTRTARGTKGRVRPAGRGTPSTGASSSEVGGQGRGRAANRGTTGTGRGPSGIGRGRGSLRGRGRGPS